MTLARTLKRHWVLVLLTIVATALVVLLALNVSSGEKKIEEKIERLLARNGGDGFPPQVLRRNDKQALDGFVVIDDEEIGRT